MKNNSAIILRCQTFESRERNLYTFLKKAFNDRIFISMNVEKNNLDSMHDIEYVIWDHKKLSKQGWPENDLGRRFGDINLYEIFEIHGNFDYYWMCEPDVFFHHISAKDFFTEFDNNEDDYLAINIKERDKSWNWFKHASVINKKVFSSSFGLVRLSKSAIHFLHNQRMKLLSFYRSKGISLQLFPM